MQEASVAARSLARVPAESGVLKPDPILIADDIRRSFGGLKAVDVDHLEIQRGAITALIGPNGAGKTTLFNLVTGFDHADRGTWSFDGRPLEGLSAYQVARAGVVRTFQLTKALTRLSVLENIKLGAPHQRGERILWSLWLPSWHAQERVIEARADELLGWLNMQHMREDFAGTCSGGQRKLVELARALMAEPKLVMLDEPVAGVNPALTQTLLERIRELPDQGMTVVFVEHDMDVVMDISDWVVVMGEGRIIAEGPPATITKNAAVIDAYLGKEHGEASVVASEPTGPSSQTSVSEHASTPTQAREADE